MKEILEAIRKSDKRMKKITSNRNSHKAMDQVRNYIIAEARERKASFTEDEIIHASVCFVMGMPL